MTQVGKIDCPMRLTGDLIRDRLREALARSGVSQVELCRRLSLRTGENWPSNRISKILRPGGKSAVIFRVDDVILICEEAGISLVELFQQPGRTLVGDLTAEEWAVIQLLRDDPTMAALILAIPGSPARRPEHARPQRRLDRRARPKGE